MVHKWKFCPQIWWSVLTRDKIYIQTGDYTGPRQKQFTNRRKATARRSIKTCGFQNLSTTDWRDVMNLTMCVCVHQNTRSTKRHIEVLFKLSAISQYMNRPQKSTSYLMTGVINSRSLVSSLDVDNNQRMSNQILWDSMDWFQSPEEKNTDNIIT